jgi:hypothetical protein
MTVGCLINGVVWTFPVSAEATATGQWSVSRRSSPPGLPCRGGKCFTSAEVRVDQRSLELLRMSKAHAYAAANGYGNVELYALAALHLAGNRRRASACADLESTGGVVRYAQPT